MQNGWVRLDFRASTTPGTVLPQVRWFPENPADFRRFVIDAVLQFPIFFVNQTGVVGFHLEDILQGSEQDLARDLQNGNGQAPLGGRTTTHIRINVGFSYPSFMRACTTILTLRSSILLITVARIPNVETSDTHSRRDSRT
jgi:hypothetical protein